LEFKRLVNLKEKIKVKKTGRQSAEDRCEKGDNPIAQSIETQDTETEDLTEKLKAAFHEKQEEDPQVRRQKELQQTICGFRKSFRQDVTAGVKQQVGGVVTGVRHQVDGVVTEVKHSISNIKVTDKAKKKEKDEEEQTDET
jgi:hypothetical protein